MASRVIYKPALLCARVAAASRPAARLLRVTAAFFPAARLLRVVAALRPATRRLRVIAALRAASLRAMPRMCRLVVSYVGGCFWAVRFVSVRCIGLTRTRSATGGARRGSCAAGLRAAATVTRGAC